MQNHLVNELTREGGTVPHTLSFLSRVKPRQPAAFCAGVQGSIANRTTTRAHAAGSSWGWGRERPPHRWVCGAAPPAVDILGSLRVHGNFSGGRVCSGLPDETDLHLKAQSDPYSKCPAFSVEFCSGARVPEKPRLRSRKKPKL